MEQEIEYLLANLESSTINSLPCYYDGDRNNNEINFRIGLKEGPQIVFHSDMQNMYSLSIRDEHQNTYHHPILESSEHFIRCIKIRDLIINLVSTKEYVGMREQKIGLLLTNVVSIVKPIIANLPK